MSGGRVGASMDLAQAAMQSPSLLYTSFGASEGAKLSSLSASNRGQSDVTTSLPIAPTTLGTSCAISTQQNEANTPVRFKTAPYTDQNSVIFEPNDEVPYISLDEFLSTDSEDLKTAQQDLCVRLASEKSQRQYEPVILQQTLPHQIESGTKLEKVLPMRNSPLTPSPSSSSSHDNEEEMGYVQAPPQHFSIYRSRQIHQQSPLQLNSGNRRLSVSSPGAVTDGSDEELFANSNEDVSKGGRRRSKKPVPDEKKDETYWRRRHKNNIAAKRSREARRMKETELTKRAALLEVEHDKLRNDLDAALRENNELKLRLSKYEDLSSLKLK